MSTEWERSGMEWRNKNENENFSNIVPMNHVNSLSKGKKRHKRQQRASAPKRRRGETDKWRKRKKRNTMPEWMPKYVHKYTVNSMPSS